MISRYLIIVLLILLSCTKEEPSVVILRTGLARAIDGDGVLLTGQLTGSAQKGIDQIGFIYWQDGGFNQKTFTIEGTPTDGVFEKKLTVGLLPGKRYAFYAYARFTQNYSSNLYEGEVNYFESQGCSGPQITGFSPASVSVGDYLTVNGTFSQIAADNAFKIGQYDFYPTGDEHSVVGLLVAYIPPGVYPISVTVGDKTAVSAGTIEIK